jgi:hypothetical protein
VPSLERGENKKPVWHFLFKAMRSGVSLHDSTAGVAEDTPRAFWVITSLGDTGRRQTWCVLEKYIIPSAKQPVDYVFCVPLLSLQHVNTQNDR